MARVSGWHNAPWLVNRLIESGSFSCLVVRPGMLSEHVDKETCGGSRLAILGGRRRAVASIGTAALIFDAVTPQIISVGMFYVGVVLIGFWFPNPKAALVLALLATPLIIVGYWITIPDNTTAWEAWLNRALAVGTVWMTAVFVWHIRLLEQKVPGQIDIANTLSSEINHRVEATSNSFLHF